MTTKKEIINMLIDYEGFSRKQAKEFVNIADKAAKAGRINK